MQEDATVRLVSHQVSLNTDQTQLQQELVAWYREKGLFTPTAKETQEHFSACPEQQVQQVIELLLREGRLVKVSESLLYEKTIIDQLIAQVIGSIEQHGEIDAPAFKNLTGLTRKFSIPILEYLDRIKLTMRIGDKRILRKR